METMKRRHLECSGTPLEMGLAQGKWARPQMEKVYRTLLETEFVPSFVKWTGSIRLLKILFALAGFRFFPFSLLRIRQEVPDQFDRLIGLSQSADIGLSGLLALNEIEVISAQLNFVFGCTSLGFATKRLDKKKGPLLAYNHDFPPFFADFLTIRRSSPRKGFASLELTYPTLTGAIGGINEEGLAVSLNHAFSQERSTSAIPPTMMVQSVLTRCKNTAAAVEFLTSSKAACGSMVSLVDRKDQMAAVELSPKRISVRRPWQGVLMTINEYQTEKLREVEVPQKAFFDPKKFPPPFHGLPIHGSNWSRRRRLAELLDRKGAFRAAEIRKILRDHEEEEKPSHLTICRHHDTAKTLSSALMWPGKSAIEVAYGNPCQGKYQTYTL